MLRLAAFGMLVGVGGRLKIWPSVPTVHVHPVHPSAKQEFSYGIIPSIAVQLPKL